MEKLNHLKIPLQAIQDSTQGFSETNFLGKGGYGKVYKGILTWADYQNLPVAIKQLDITGFQGQKEFYTEVLMLSQYRHQNIVSLIGFCEDGKEMILVYEYASRGSLDTYLSDPAKLEQLSWEKRLDICVGVASALDYLHNQVVTQHRIIYRDIKSANILLDENWNAKLADFGLSKICLANQQHTFVVTNLAGTHGYCDPQYETTGILTKESDIYSFGVVLFEILCGRLACVVKYHDKRRFLHHLARTCYKNGEIDTIIDHEIREHIKPKTLSMFTAIAYQCLQETREERPTIAKTVIQLMKANEIQMSSDSLPFHYDNEPSISKKIVDDVNGGFKRVNLIKEGNLQPQKRQQTLSDMTLEDFLRKAGVVVENNQTRPSSGDMTLEDSLLKAGVVAENNQSLRSSLGDMTLEDFLLKAGVVAENNQMRSSLGDMTLEDFLLKAGVVAGNNQTRPSLGDMTLEDSLLKVGVVAENRQMRSSLGDMTLEDSWLKVGVVAENSQMRSSLGDMTLEDFLLKAGVVAENNQTRPSVSEMTKEEFLLKAGVTAENTNIPMER